MSAKTAFVTGASRGIGKGIAIELARAGFDVAISARTVRKGEKREYSESTRVSFERAIPGSLEETAAAIEALGRRCLSIPMDLTDYASVGAGTQLLLDRWPELDVVVHNGRYLGPGIKDNFFDTPNEALQKVFEAHCVAPVIMTRAILPGMLKRGGGTIVTVTSSSFMKASAKPASEGGQGLGYQVGKAAGHQLAFALYTEFRSRGIRAMNFYPGEVATERKEASRELGRRNGGIPAEAVGKALAWLLTDPEGLANNNVDTDAYDIIRKHKLYAI